MPITPIKAPDGSIIKVNHPEGATKTDIGHAAQVIYQNKQIAAQERQQRIEGLRRSNPGEFDPNSDEFKEKYGPTKGFLSNLAAGSGKALVDLGRGARQLSVEGANLIPGVNLDDKAADLRRQASDTRELDSALMSTGGGLVGNIGTNIGLALLPGGAASGTSRVANTARAFSNPQTYRAAAGSGAAIGALNPVGEDESRGVNVALGSGSGVIGKAIAQPILNNLNRAGQASRQLLEDAGVPLNLAQRTGSNRAATLSGILDDSVLTGNAQEAFKETQLRAFTRATLRTIGQNAEEATPDVMRQARTDIGNVFNNVARNSNGVRADQQLFQGAADVFQRAQIGLLDDEFRLFERNFRNILGAVDNGRINASRFNASLSDLGRLSTRPNIGTFARELEDVLLDGLERSSPLERATLSAARGQWRNLRIIQGAIGKGEDRLISPLRLSSTLANKQNQNLSVFGLGRDESLELANLARAGRELLPDFANSGTARRQQALTLGSLGGLTAAGLAAGGPVGGAIGFGTGIAAPSLLQRLLTSQGVIGNLVENGLPGVAQPIVKQAAIQAGQQVQ